MGLGFICVSGKGSSYLLKAEPVHMPSNLLAVSVLQKYIPKKNKNKNGNFFFRSAFPQSGQRKAWPCGWVMVVESVVQAEPTITRRILQLCLPPILLLVV